jgi:ribosome-associated protein
MIRQRNNSFWRSAIATQVKAARKTVPEAKTDEQKQQARIESARAFSIDAARLAVQTHCQNVVVLDVSAISPVTDFLVIATGTSPRQMRSVCDEIQEMGFPRNYKARFKPSSDGEHWLLIDFVDVVVHVFAHDAREFYDLENLWGDGKKVEVTPA